eukprot:TRINITY_DN11652_c0_g1_i1.p1 TRINITY_DN11652_c0_g1~~TRINITY_DN11652_c0_g1_i1.p1  ORF type:complete len:817 (-),score=201.31 TRINITY_DN11652_c0_g1_i1:95-2470(-)
MDVYEPYPEFGCFNEECCTFYNGEYDGMNRTCSGETNCSTYYDCCVVHYQEDQECCVNSGGTWNSDTCSFDTINYETIVNTNYASESDTNQTQIEDPKTTMVPTESECVENGCACSEEENYFLIDSKCIYCENGYNFNLQNCNCLLKHVFFENECVECNIENTPSDYCSCIDIDLVEGDSSSCECGGGMVFIDNRCACPENQEYSNNSLSCQCSGNFVMNGGGECEESECGNGFWNDESNECESCGEEKVFNIDTGICEECGLNYFIDGKTCVHCSEIMACECDGEQIYDYDLNSCVQCEGSFMYDPVYQLCYCDDSCCEDNEYWEAESESCKSSCIQCGGNDECPQGTVDIDGDCVCELGRVPTPDGSSCVRSCDGDFVLIENDHDGYDCGYECDEGFEFDFSESVCIEICDGDTDPVTYRCIQACDDDQRWTGYNCESTDCKPWEKSSNQECFQVCEIGQVVVNYYSCNDLCELHQKYNEETEQCDEECEVDQIYRDNACISCGEGIKIEDRTCTQECVEGYKRDGFQCIDIDECSNWNENDGNTHCSSGTTCNNFDGGYTCNCLEGRISENPKKYPCEEVSCDGYLGSGFATDCVDGVWVYETKVGGVIINEDINVGDSKLEVEGDIEFSDSSNIYFKTSAEGDDAGSVVIDGCVVLGGGLVVDVNQNDVDLEKILFLSESNCLSGSFDFIRYEEQGEESECIFGQESASQSEFSVTFMLKPQCEDRNQFSIYIGIGVLVFIVLVVVLVVAILTNGTLRKTVLPHRDPTKMKQLEIPKMNQDGVIAMN